MRRRRPPDDEEHERRLEMLRQQLRFAERLLGAALKTGSTGFISRARDGVEFRRRLVEEAEVRGA